MAQSIQNVVHLAGRAHLGKWPLRSRAHQRILWEKLRAAFPREVLAAVCMENHVHLVVQTGDRPGGERFARQRLSQQLRAFSRECFAGGSIWAPCEEVEPIRDMQKLETVIRYVHLNPCRAGLTRDPWSWEFSTLYDHTEPGVNPWVRASVHSILARGRRSWAERHSNFVLQDPTVDPACLRERRQSLLGLRSLGLDAVAQVIARVHSCELSALQSPGAPRDLWLRAHSLVWAPEMSARKRAELLRVNRTRLREVCRKGLSAREKLALKNQAYHLARMIEQQRGPGSLEPAAVVAAPIGPRRRL